MKYIYTRRFNAELGRYEIDYGNLLDSDIESPKLIEEIVNQFPSKSVSVCCYDNECKIIIDELTDEEKIQLDNIVENH